jgi:Flp pilus assembly protein TadB
LRYAAPRRLHSNRTGLIFFVAVFVLGAILFALGTLLVRRERLARKAASQSMSQEDRLDMIERLVMVGQPWCVDELRAILNNDADPVVRDAADAALLVIGSR